MNGYELRKQRKADAIKRAAIELFNTHGVGKVSIAEIARRAGVNPVTIYNHFHDRGSLVRTLVEELVRADWARTRVILDSDRPFLERLQDLVAAKMERARTGDNGFLASALADDESIGAYVRGFFDQEVTPRLSRFFREGQREGTVRGDLSVGLLNLFLEMFTDLPRTHPEALSGGAPLARITDGVWGLFLYGVAGQKPTTAPAARAEKRTGR